MSPAVLISSVTSHKNLIEGSESRVIDLPSGFFLNLLRGAGRLMYSAQGTVRGEPRTSAQSPAVESLDASFPQQKGARAT